MPPKTENIYAQFRTKLDEEHVSNFDREMAKCLKRGNNGGYNE